MARPVAEIVADLRRTTPKWVMPGAMPLGYASRLDNEAADELERLDDIIQHLTVAVCVVCGQGGAVWCGNEYRHIGCGGGEAA